MQKSSWISYEDEREFSRVVRGRHWSTWWHHWRNNWVFIPDKCWLVIAYGSSVDELIVLVRFECLRRRYWHHCFKDDGKRNSWQADRCRWPRRMCSRLLCSLNEWRGTIKSYRFNRAIKILGIYGILGSQSKSIWPKYRCSIILNQNVNLT